MNKETAARLLSETQANYDGFAESFSATRNYLWPGIGQLLDEHSSLSGDVLDIGCGNGRFSSFFKERGMEYHGIDNSQKLISIAQSNFPDIDFKVASALDLPYGQNEFDLAFSLAVLHHIPSGGYRRQFLEEAFRVLKPGGVLFLAVWDLRPWSMIRRRRFKRLKGYLAAQIKIILKLENLDFGDFYIPWENRYRRYHHAFSRRELEKFAKDAGFAIESSGTVGLGKKEANLYIIAKKCEK